MFDGLKKKFSSFIDSLSKKEAEKEPEKEQPVLAAQDQTPVQLAKAEPKAEPQPEPKIEAKHEPAPKPIEITKEEQSANAIPKHEPRLEPFHSVQQKPQQASEPHKATESQPVYHQKSETQKAHEAPRQSAEITPHQKPQANANISAAEEAHNEKAYSKPQETIQSKEPKVSTTTKIKGFFLGHVKISEKDADPFIESLKMGLLQSDVNYDVAERVAESIRHTLVGKQVSSRNIEGDIRQGIRESITNVLSKSSEIDIVGQVNAKKINNQLPYKILFVGPNGAGKTTTMAKIANMLISNNITCVLSASDTFRAAAIEQTAYHASKLGVNVIKGTYGADPASVAFDAIAHAKAHGIMVVLIDSAGRQETNKSLIEELKKISRVTSPDLKIFIGESISGNALLDQVKVINEAVKLDGIILTKLDVDAKGGNTLSILSDTTIPILYFGTGEKYTDMMRYDPQFIVDNILPNN